MMQLYYKILFVFFLGAVFFSSAQAQEQHEIDSLANILKTAKEDTNKVNALNTLSYKLSEKGDYEKAKKYADVALRLSEKISYKKGEGNAYNNKGISYTYLGNYPDALKNYFASLKIEEKIGSKISSAMTYNNIGLIYWYQRNYPEALKQYFASLKIAEELGNKFGIAMLRNNIGLIYTDQNKYENALKNFFVALKIRESIGDKKGISYCYNNIGQVFIKQGNYPDALKNYFTSLKILKEIHDKQAIVVSYSNIGSIYSKLKKFSEAKKYLDDALLLSKEIALKERIMISYEGLAELDSAVGNYKQSLQHYKFYIIYKDSIFNETSSKQTAEMKTKYETEKKDNEITLLNKDKEIQNIEIKKQTLLKNSFLGGLALVLVLFFFVYKNYRTRQKLKLENIRNNIAADLHDDIGSTLNSISLFSEVAKQEAEKSIPALDQIGVSARKIIDAMSDIVWTINPENDNFENVIARMRSLSYMLLKAKAIEFSFKADENLNQLSLPMQVRKNFYLLFKEAINNLVKYSNATRASFHLSLENKNVKMVIRDNGVGFDMENAQMGNGIKNMKRRAAEIGAQLLIESSEGKGTNIELSFKA